MFGKHIGTSMTILRVYTLQIVVKNYVPCPVYHPDQKPLDFVEPNILKREDQFVYKLAVMFN